MTNRAQIINAGVALAILLGFAVGIPWVNIATGGHPEALLPNSWPDLSDPDLLQHAWETVRWSFLDASLWLWLAHTALWLVWAVGLVWTVADVVRFIRLGLVVVHHAGRPRGWVSSLVAAVLVVVLAGTAHAGLTQQPAVVATAVDDRPDPGLTMSLAPSAKQPVTVEVQPGDSLSSIAGRLLGDRNRWHELWEQNRDVIQADGRALTNPNLIRPKWKLVAYIPAPPLVYVPPSPPPPCTPATTPTIPTTTPILEPDHVDSQNAPAEPGVDLTTGAYVSLAVAAAVTAAFASVRFWRRRQYRIGSGDRNDLDEPIAPAVRDLHLAHEHTDAVPSDTAGVDSVRLGVRDSREVALDVAASRGLGLVGDGAVAAARALVLHALTIQNVRILVPQHDLRKLLDANDLDAYPSALIVTPSLDAALDELEANAMAQLVNLEEGLPAQLLVATPAASATRRLRAVLGNGSGSAAAGILMGTWESGTTSTIHSDGTVGGNASPLSGSRLYNLPADDLRDLLALLEQAETIEAGSQPVNEELTSHLVPHAIDTSVPEAKPLSLKVFGQVELAWHHGDTPQDITDLLTPKQRELLVYLALKPVGARREELNKAVWPDSPAVRPYNSLHTAMSLLRRSLGNATDGAIRHPVLHDEGLYRLNHGVVDVDCWRLKDMLDGRIRITDQILTIYRGELATDLRPLWLEAPREAMRRDVLDALSRLVRNSATPEQALSILEQMRKLDVYNENIYRDIMRIQVSLRQREAARRTLDLLRKTLAELGQRPTTDTLDLVQADDRRGRRDVGVGG